MNESTNSDPIIKEDSFQKKVSKLHNFNKIGKVSPAGNSNDQSDSKDFLRQNPLIVENSEHTEEINSSLDKCNDVTKQNTVPPPPKLRKKSSFSKLGNSMNSTSCLQKSIVGGKQKHENKIGKEKRNSVLTNNSDSKALLNKEGKTLPPLPPLLPMPNSGLKSSSVPTVAAEPKIIKKGDTVIKSYVDEKTGKIAVYEPGIKLEVCHYDSGRWYPAKVIEVDLKEAEILIHYEKWSSRFDEWIKMDSNRLRPSANTNVVKVEFKVGEKVDAIWNTDGQRYPGVIIQVFPQQDYYEVQFDDGIKCKKKSNQIFKIKRTRGRQSVECFPPPVKSTPTPSSSKSDSMNNHVTSASTSTITPQKIPEDAGAVLETTVETKPIPAIVESLASTSTATPAKISPTVHFSIFTPPAGELGKRKRTIQDYSALLKRPSKLSSFEIEDTSHTGDLPVVTVRKRKRVSIEVNASSVRKSDLPPESEVTSTPALSSVPEPVVEEPNSITPPAPQSPSPAKVKVSQELPAKRIRKPSRRWSLLDDEKVCTPSEEKLSKPEPSRKRISHHSVSLPLKYDIKEEDNDDNDSLNAFKDDSIQDEDYSPKITSPNTPSKLDDKNSYLSDSSDKSPHLSDPSIYGPKTKRRGRIQYRAKIPTDLDNLDIPPPPVSGYRLKKLYLEIEKVTEVNIEQVVTDPEGIIFKLNDPVPEGWRKEAQLKFRNETYPKWFISYVSPAGDRFRYLKQMYKLIQEANFDFTPFDFRPLNPRLQEIAKRVSGGHYHYKRRTNMPPPPILSEIESFPGVCTSPVHSPSPAPPTRRTLAYAVQHQQQKTQSPMASPSAAVPFDAKVISGFVDSEGNDVTIEQSEDGGWACPAQVCDKHFRKYSLLQMHLKHYHPEMKVKALGGVKIANVVEMAQARTAFDYEEHNNGGQQKVISSLNEYVDVPLSPSANLPSVPNNVETQLPSPSKKIPGRRSQIMKDKDSKEKIAEEPVSELESSSTTEQPLLVPKLESIDIDIVDERDNEFMDDQDRSQEDGDAFTDAVEISASEYKRPRINLRRKFVNKRMMFRLPSKNSVKVESQLPGTSGSITGTLVEPKNEIVPNEATEPNNSQVLQPMSQCQIVVEKCDTEASSEAPPTKVLSNNIPFSKPGPSTSTTSFANALRTRYSSIRFINSIRRRERKVASLQAQRAINLVRGRKGVRGSRQAVRKPVGYFSGLSKKQSCRIRRELVNKNLVVRLKGEPTSSDVKVDIINCICNRTDEFGMMVQCELCHCWQHGNCFGYYEDEDLPKFYVCESCKNPGNVSRTKFWEWQIQGYYKTGQLPSFPGARTTNSSNARIRAQCSEAKKWILNTVESIESCNTKLNVVQSKANHPKLYYWERPTENPVRLKQIHDFRKTYKPWFVRRLKAIQSSDPEFRKTIRKSFLMHLHWKRYFMLVEDFKWGVRSLDPKFSIVLHKLSIYQKWRVLRTMENNKRLNVADDETPLTNPYAIWARKHRQRQQWEAKMRSHANMLEKQLQIEEQILNSKLSNENSTATESETESLYKNSKYSSGDVRLHFCRKCVTSAGKTWNWSDLAENHEDFFGNFPISGKNYSNSSDTQRKKQSVESNQPRTLKELCDEFLQRYKVEKIPKKVDSSSLPPPLHVNSTNLIDVDHSDDPAILHTPMGVKEDSRCNADDLNCSDTTESVGTDLEDTLTTEMEQSGSDIVCEECIRCYLKSISLSQYSSYPTYISSLAISEHKNTYKTELIKYNAVNYRDILTFLNLPDALKQGVWDSIENALPSIPVKLKRIPYTKLAESQNGVKIIRHYNAEMKRFWPRMFNVRVRGVSLPLQQQSWVDELVRIYSEIQIVLENMLKVVDDSTQVEKLGETLMRKIDIFRAICATPEANPLETFKAGRGKFNMTTNAFKKVKMNESQDKKISSTTKNRGTSKKTQIDSRPLCRKKDSLADSTESINNSIEEDTEKVVMEIVEKCISQVESEENVGFKEKACLGEAASDEITVESGSQVEEHKNEIPFINSEEIAPVNHEIEKKISVENKIVNISENKDGSVDNIKETPDLLDKSESRLSEDNDTTQSESDNVPMSSSSEFGDESFENFKIRGSLAEKVENLYVFNRLAMRETKRVPKHLQTSDTSKLNAETCRENLLQNILRQQELIDSHLDKLEEKVYELERKYTKRKIDPMSTKKWVQMVQLMVFYSKKLKFLKSNAELICGGEEPERTGRKISTERRRSYIKNIKAKKATITPAPATTTTTTTTTTTEQQQPNSVPLTGTTESIGVDAGAPIAGTDTQSQLSTPTNAT